MVSTSQRAAAADRLLAVSRVMTAVVARSLADVSLAVTVPQLRVLVMLSTRGELNVGAIATGLGVNPSNASRTCEQLVFSGLVTRSADPRDRRNVLLTLSPAGVELIGALMQRRLEIFEGIVASMPATDCVDLTRGIDAFLRALEGPSVSGLSSDGPLSDILPWLL